MLLKELKTYMYITIIIVQIIHFIHSHTYNTMSNNNIDDINTITVEFNERHKLIREDKPFTFIMRNKYLPNGISHVKTDTYDFLSCNIMLDDTDKLNVESLDEYLETLVEKKKGWTFQSFVYRNEYQDKVYYTLKPKVSTTTHCFDSKSNSVEIDGFMKYGKRIHADVLITPQYFEYADGKLYGFKLYLNQIKLNMDTRTCSL